MKWRRCPTCGHPYLERFWLFKLRFRRKGCPADFSRKGSWLDGFPFERVR